MRVSLSSMPDPKTVNTVTLTNLSGGLNLLDDPAKVGSRQSPDMMNMWYRDGALRKRWGQEEVFGESETEADGQVWFYDRLFYGLIVYVQGTVIFYFDPARVTEKDYVPVSVTGTKIHAGAEHGCFFAFDECLYYKARGIYLRLRYESGVLTAENLLWKGTGSYICGDTYLPVIAINRRADGTGGNAYQPENRINPKKEVWFDIDKESYEYFLPVNGCTVESVQLGDDKLALSESTSPGGTYSLNGHRFTVVNQTDGATLKTSLKFSEPLYIDETGWAGKDWTNQESKGWNYLGNVVYSDFPLKATADTAFTGGEVLRRGDETGVPAELTNTFLAQAMARCPYTGYTDYFILDNGEWMNVFLLGYINASDGNEDGSMMGDDNLYDYNEDTTELWLKNYFLVSYEYGTGTWSTKDYSGRSDSGWHYAKNLVYSTRDFVVAAGTSNGLDGTTPQYVYAIEAGVNSSNLNRLYGKSLLQIAENACGGTSSNRKLLWVSANSSIWTFHFLMNGGKFYATKYDEGQGWFQGYGIRMVTIQKTDPMNPTVKDMTEPGQWGFYVKNIIWAAEDLCYYGYTPGDEVLKKTETALPAIYKKYVETALYRARRDYPNANITGKYAVSVKDPYVTIYIDAGMELTEYDVKTGEFKATGWISEGYTMDDAYSDLTIHLTSPEAMSNQLRVIYKKDNSEAMKAIGDCWAATDFGGSDAVTVVMGGCDGQPNAIFWSGNGSEGVDATYFPVDQYNLCGAYQDPVMGFGKQQSALIVFQSHHTSKASYGITEISGRKYIDLSLSTINAEKGCDRPWSICLCGNNLCWIHSKYGVLYLKDTSSAYENQIVVISEHVNGNSLRPGLLKDLSKAERQACIGTEDGKRYYCFVGGSLYVWDYSLGTVGQGIDELSWTRHGEFSAQSAMETSGALWMIGGNGRISRMKEGLDRDFGKKIRCHYRTPTMDFGGYYRRRSVEKVILTIGRNREEPVDIFYGGEGQMYRHPAPGFAMERTEADWVPMVLRPRGLRLHHFFLQVESSGPLELSEILVLYTSGGKTK